MENLITMRKVTTSGVKEIAKALDGGIFANSLVMIEGETGTGKSVLSQYLAHDAIASPYNRAVYYTTEKTARGLLNQMKSLSLNAIDSFLTSRFQIYPLRITRFDDNGIQFRRLLHHISNLDKQFNLVVLDSVTPLLQHGKIKDKIDFIYQCKKLCKMGRSIVLIANPHVIEEQLLPRMLTLVDYHLALKAEEVLFDSDRKEHRMVKVLEIIKSHGVEHQIIKRVRFEVLPQMGIHMVPFNELKL